MCQAVLANGLASAIALLGNVRGFVVSDHRGQCRTEHQALFYGCCNGFAVRLQAFNAFFRKRRAHISDQSDAFKQGFSHHWHGEIEFHHGSKAAHISRPDRDVIACNAHGDLHDRFHHDRVDLAWHDG